MSHVSSSWCRLLQGAILHVNPAFFRVTSHCLTTAEGLSLEELLGGVSAEDGKAGWEGRLRDRAAAKLSPPPQDTPAAAAREEEEEGSPVVCRQHVRRASGGLCWSVWMMGLLPRERAFVAMLEELEEEEEDEEPGEAPTQPGLAEHSGRQQEEEPHQASSSSSEGRGAEEGQQQPLEEAPPHEDGGDDDNPEQG